ncbi:hypothetical protein NY478_06775, partial [Enterobacter hormaechei]|nr:hypothetical protein [Enterobacter hormaechei]
ELGALGKMIIAQVVLTGLWNLAFSIIPDGKLLSFFGVNIWQSGSYLVLMNPLMIFIKIIKLR